jgi:hypothetical protein
MRCVCLCVLEQIFAVPLHGHIGKLLFLLFSLGFVVVVVVIGVKIIVCLPCLNAHISPPPTHSKTGVYNEPSTTGRFITEPDICAGTSLSGDVRTGCGSGKVCARYDHNPMDDTILFDDIWNSFVAMYRVMLRDNWMLTMWDVQDGVNSV